MTAAVVTDVAETKAGIVTAVRKDRKKEIVFGTSLVLTPLVVKENF